jgi:putative pyoverdin transport system ATP-binding/permease protein
MFNFLKLINRRKAVAIFVLGLISGLMSFLFLAFINLMIGLILQKKNTLDLNYIILFCSLILIFMWSKMSLSYIVIKFSQQIFWKLRSEVLHTILKANFYQFNKHKDQIHAVLIHDVNILTHFSLSIIQFLSAFIMTIGCFIYMGMQSPLLLLITLGISILGVTIYWIGVHFNRKKFALSRGLENSFMKSFLDIISGFKEIYMNPKIGRDIFNRKIKKISNESFINNTEAYTGFLNVQITGEILFYLLIAFILICHSLFIHQSAASIVNFVFILLYLLGSINTIMLIIPVLVQARIASNKLYKLKNELSDERFENQMENREISITEFKVLEVSDLKFTYKIEKSEVSFSIGPINLSLEKGEMIFIYGGNGSGKTTLINALLGILQVDSGVINFNNKKLCANNYSDYQTLFSVVFSDFHLFEELYGFEHIPENMINDYLEMFELNGKVSYKNNSFSSNNLSTGQRKRLGLIIALIRLNPILVLDEWAADQDPLFRKKFYVQILPKLKAKGFSIIAITHDDAYYHVADKLYKMEFGQLTYEPPSNLI